MLSECLKRVRLDMARNCSGRFEPARNKPSLCECVTGMVLRALCGETGAAGRVLRAWLLEGRGAVPRKHT